MWKKMQCEADELFQSSMNIITGSRSRTFLRGCSNVFVAGLFFMINMCKRIQGKAQRGVSNSVGMRS